uniref:peptidylprolyl isomerase n=1 Tax=Homalodisca liturata TaxID=320908 RepID=A0A1B6IG76_9HEMI
MPSVFDSSVQDRYFDEVISAPVISLTEGLPLSELLNTHQTEFEVRPDSDEDESLNKFNSAESCFNFNDLEHEINLNVLDEEEGDGGGSPFDKYRKKMTKLRDDGKIMKSISKQGFGCTVPENCLVYVRYKAYVEYQEIPFDSTFMQSNGSGNLSVPLNLGKGEVLPGLHEAILTMKKGEKAEFLIHPDLCYGKMGCPPRIPEEATILFLVEIERFVDCGDIYSNFDDLSSEERLEFSNIYPSAKGYYELGNDCFKKESYNSAVVKYRRVINMLHNARLANEEEENKRNHFLIKNYTNACVCYNQLKNYKKVCIMAADAVKVSHREAFKNSKLLYFWGVAKMHLNDYEGAKKTFDVSQKVETIRF